jgi:hypothetical protein
VETGWSGLEGVGVGDGGLLELLHHRAHLGLWARRRSWFIQDLALRRREHTPDSIDKLTCVMGSPEVDVKGVELVVVLVLVVRVVGGQMPIVVSLDLADGKCHKASVLVRVADVDSIEVWRIGIPSASTLHHRSRQEKRLKSKAVLTAVKCVLVIGPRMVCDLQAGAPLVRILEKVNVRPLVEPVMRRVVGRRSVEVVDVSVASNRASD